MQRLINKNIFLPFITLLMASFVNAQQVPEQFEAFLSNSTNSKKKDAKLTTQIKKFYQLLKYQTAWIQKNNRAELDIFINQVQSSVNIGLRPKDYSLEYISAFRDGVLPIRNMTDSFETEIQLTETAIHFYNDIFIGNTKPQFRYEDVTKITDNGLVIEQLANHISDKKLQSLSTALSPSLQEVTVINTALQSLLLRREKDTEALVRADKLNKQNLSLIVRLYQLGLTSDPEGILNDSTQKQAIRSAQIMFNLPSDGILNKETLQELNVPLSVRVQQLCLSINYYRWLSGLNENTAVIVVNIPAAGLSVYKDNEVILTMRMIVGKPSTPTPTLSSHVESVVLYPYWHVPYSIVTNELLPILKRDPGFIKAGNYQVLNSSGKLINPFSINWSAYSTKYFPFTIRQSTGCDNALGLLKLDFPSPFGVYLHDTPVKILFNARKRFMSHGCMRMEKPMEMGHLVLQNNQIAIDTLTQKGCLRNQSPIVVPADVRMPVIVWYNPVGIDKDGKLVFYQDIYKKFKYSK